MIKSNRIDEVEYDVKCQNAALELIATKIRELKGDGDFNRIEMLQYFCREYCRVEGPGGLFDEMTRHMDLTNEIEIVAI